MSEREDTSFKITDRRKFNADGTPREAAEPEPEAAPVAAEVKTRVPPGEQVPDNVVSFPGDTAKAPPEASASPRVAAANDQAGRSAPPSSDASAEAGKAEQAYNQARGKSPELPEASFVGLINMLGVEIAMHLGLMHPPGEEAPAVDLESARHLIDLLGMLQVKTRGNLTPEEDNLLENILADLRMQFVVISRKG